jgi:hypothetical protein
MDANSALARLWSSAVFAGKKTKKNGEQGEAVVVEAGYTGMSNSHGQRKYKLTLRVRTADGTMVDAQTKAYGLGAGMDTSYRAEGLVRMAEERRVGAPTGGSASS